MTIKYWIIIWIVCGIFNWGVVLGDFSGHFPDSNPRDYYGMAAFIAVTGPFGTIVSAFMSNFYQHGLRWK